MSSEHHENKDEFNIWKVPKDENNWMHPFLSDDVSSRQPSFSTDAKSQLRLNEDSNSSPSDDTYVNPVASAKLKPPYPKGSVLDSHQLSSKASNSKSKNRDNKTSEIRRHWNRGGATLPQDYDAHLRAHNRLPFKRHNSKGNCIELVTDRIQKLKNDEKIAHKEAKKTKANQVEV